MPQPWTNEAFAAPVTRDRDGTRVIGLAWLVLMKLDASRSIDQGDLSRTLGRVPRDEVERIATIVVRHDPDASKAEDNARYAEIDRWEYESSRFL